MSLDVKNLDFMVAPTFNLSTQETGQVEELHEFVASLAYTVSSRPDTVTWWGLVSKI